MIDLKKLVAVILALTMAFSLAAPAAFAVDGKCDCGQNPIIYVGPLGNSDIYENPNAEDERTLFRPSTGAIVSLVLKLLPALPSLLLFKNYDSFGDVLIDAVYDAFGAMALDGNGDSLENVAVKPDPLPTDPPTVKATIIISAMTGVLIPLRLQVSSTNSSSTSRLLRATIRSTSEHLQWAAS